MQKNSKTPLPSMNDLDRRSVLVGAASLGGMALLTPQAALALSVKDAENLIRKVTGEVQSIINSGQSQTALIRKFEGVFQRYADVPRIAATLLGPPWRSANDADRNAYVQALTGYLARKYGKRFREFTNAEISITKSQDLGNKGVIVETLIRTSVYEPFPVEWWVIDDGTKRSFFDIIIEGVRLQSAERGEIRALLDRSGGSVAKLAATLNQLG